jgi:hypothetical protein
MGTFRPSVPNRGMPTDRLCHIPTVTDWIGKAYPDPDYRAMVLQNWPKDVDRKQMQFHASPIGPDLMGTATPFQGDGHKREHTRGQSRMAIPFLASKQLLEDRAR